MVMDLKQNNINRFYKTLERKFKENSLHHCAYTEPYDDCYHDLYNDLFYKNCVFRNKLSNGYYIEIGGLDGVVNSQSFIFEKHLKWDGIIVEPNPVWHKNLKLFRNCKISEAAISNKNGNSLFECRDMAAFSGLVSNSSNNRLSKIENCITVETITLIDLLNRYDSPDIIDWVSIDTEGGEFDILEHFFENESKYKINLINIESAEPNRLYELFKNKPYAKIKNPYLNFLRLHTEHGLVKFQPISGEIYKSHFIDFTITDIDDLLEITFEHYYVHIDLLKSNPHLKKYLI